MTFVKFLGVIIDEELTWKNHISTVLKTIIKCTGLIAKLRHYTNRNTLKLIYYALAYPYLTYGNLFWGNTYPTRLQKIMNVQKKIAGLICFKSYSNNLITSDCIQSVKEVINKHAPLKKHLCLK